MSRADYLINEINASAELAIIKANEWLNENKAEEMIKDIFYDDIRDYVTERGETMAAYKELKTKEIDIEKLERKLAAFLKITDLKYKWLADHGHTFTDDRIERLGKWIDELYIRMRDEFKTVKKGANSG